MSIMSRVTQCNLHNFINRFPPFFPEPGDEFLIIKTYDPMAAVVCCLFAKSKRITPLDLVYEPGFYAYVSHHGDTRLWYNPNVDNDENLNSLISFLNVDNVFDPRAMQSMGFTAAYFQ